MSEQSETLQILRDCGLSDSQIERFLTDCSGDPDRQIRFLRLYRPELMRSLRRTQKQVDCLDFLVRRLEKKKIEDGTQS